MMSSVNVHIAQVKMASNGEELHTILGSCIGIGFLWPKRGVYGLAHCLLPTAPADCKQAGARYVDQAVVSMIQLMDITNVRDIRAVVAGGGNMTMPDTAEPEKLIGFQNARSAIEQLGKHKIRIVHEDTGGCEGRKMIICSNTGTFDVRLIPRMAA